jgi:hypothetical protein
MFPNGKIEAKKSKFSEKCTRLGTSSERMEVRERGSFAHVPRKKDATTARGTVN